jgi:hypothetical protein
MHYGVPGMKWGRRKASTTSYGTARAQYKAAKKAYNKSFNKAYNYSGRHAIGQYINKDKKAESNRRWDDAYNKSVELNQAKKAYKQAKQERKQAIGAAKSAYKSANRAYNKAYNKAYNYSALHPISQWTGKSKAEADRRWDNAANKLAERDRAKNAYKKTKADYRRG